MQADGREEPPAQGHLEPQPPEGRGEAPAGCLEGAPILIQDCDLQTEQIHSSVLSYQSVIICCSSPKKLIQIVRRYE